MIHDGALEVFFADAEFVNYLVKLGLNEHFFLLSHLHNCLFVQLSVIVLQSFSSFDDQLLFPYQELRFSVKRADLEDLQKLSEIDSTFGVELKCTKLVEICIKTIVCGLLSAIGKEVVGDSTSNDSCSSQERVLNFDVHSVSVY